MPVFHHVFELKHGAITVSHWNKQFIQEFYRLLFKRGYGIVYCFCKVSLYSFRLVKCGTLWVPSVVVSSCTFYRQLLFSRYAINIIDIFMDTLAGGGEHPKIWQHSV